MDGKSIPLQCKQRENWIDVLKGITILLVILGHCTVPDYIVGTIYLFHMPLFFMISGYLDNTNNSTRFRYLVVRKTPRLLWPYFIYGVIVIFWKTFVFWGEKGNLTFLMGKRVIALLYGNYIWENNSDYIGTLWFLICLFCVGCISFLVHRMRNDKLRMLITVAIVSCGSLLCKCLIQWGIRLPWCLDVALVAIFFYEVGAYFKEWRRCSFLAGAILLGIGLALGNCNVCDSTKVDMLLLDFGVFPLFLISATLISLGFMIIARSTKISNKFIEYIGRQSLTIMVSHLHIITIVTILGNKFSFALDGWIVFISTTILSILACFIVEKFFPFLNDFRYINQSVNK